MPSLPILERVGSLSVATSNSENVKALSGVSVPISPKVTVLKMADFRNFRVALFSII
jgi:hypothetical protein